jgi:hypothetical protein
MSMPKSKVPPLCLALERRPTNCFYTPSLWDDIVRYYWSKSPDGSSSFGLVQSPEFPTSYGGFDPFAVHVSIPLTPWGLIR